MAEELKDWQEWKIVKQLGEGGYGKVYEIVRNRYSIEEHRALKVIRIPSSEDDVKKVMGEGMDKESTQAYYHSLVNEFIKEIAFLSELRGSANIVTYDDYKVVERKDGVGYDILIMMELLTPLPELLEKHSLTEDEVKKLGMDLCDALSLCHSKNILHRDIKADNIFVANDGTYKLGDFGIARTVEKTASAHTRIGTNSYMAPETYRGQNYDRRADLYSLGILLYRLLNDNRNPFLPPYPEPVTVQDRDEAMTKRLMGDPFPRPAHGSDALVGVVLKACAYLPQDRYDSAADMKAALKDPPKPSFPRVGAHDASSHLTQRADEVDLSPRAATGRRYRSGDEYAPAPVRPMPRQNDPYYQRGETAYREPSRAPYPPYRDDRYDRRAPQRRPYYENDYDNRSSGISAGLAVVIVLIALVIIGGGITIFALLNRNAADTVTVEEDRSVTSSVDNMPLNPDKTFSIHLEVKNGFDTPVALQGYADGDSLGDPQYITQSGAYDFTIASSKDATITIMIDSSEYYSCTLDYTNGTVINESYNPNFYSSHTIN